MIRVSKIAHAAYETPDLAQQTEYYTDIIGLSLLAQEKDTVYLASTVDHHSIVLRKGAPAQCTRVGLQIPDAADLDAFESQVKGRGIVTERRKDPEPSIKDMLVFADPSTQPVIRDTLKNLIEVSFTIGSPGSRIVIYETDAV